MKLLHKLMLLLVFGILLMGLLFAQTPPAQNNAVQRTILDRADSSIAGREGVGVLAEFAPGARTGRHTHPGDEIDYVLEGIGELLIDGKPQKIVRAGDATVIPGGTVHDAHNLSSVQPLKVWAVFVVEKGKPLTTNAQ
jgi:quercetin dioxygenase-like cupin family protein